MKTKLNGKDGQIYDTATGQTVVLIPYFDAENPKHIELQTLLSAAPELLEACKNLIEQCSWIPKETFTQTGKTAFKIALNNVEQAIFKATNP